MVQGLLDDGALAGIETPAVVVDLERVDARIAKMGRTRPEHLGTPVDAPPRPSACRRPDVPTPPRIASVT